MSRDAGEDGKVLLAAALPKSLADNPNNNVGSFVVHYCKWSTTVTLCLVNCRLDYIIFFVMVETLQGPFTEVAAHTIRVLSTPKFWFILSTQLLLSTMGTTASCSLSVDVSWVPVSPQPDMKAGYESFKG